MANIVVEIHVPLVPSPDIQPSEYPFPWIDMIEDFLAAQDHVEVFDDGEEDDGVYIFFITGAAEDVLLEVAGRVAGLDRVPDGVFAVVTDDQTPGFGQGRRVSLPAG